MTGENTISFAGDGRGRIPFAVLGVLLLVGSLTLVHYHETRPEPVVDADASLAMDRTVAASQTVLRDAVLDATEAAAREPLATVEDDEYGRALAGDDPAAVSEDELFERYVKLRIYLEVSDRFDRSGQTVSGDVETSVGVDDVTDAEGVEDAIDAVTLVVGGDGLEHGDSGEDELGHGQLTVTIEDVRFTADRERTVVADRTRDLTVTVGSPVFALRDGTRAYERRLNAGFGEGAAYGGFTEYVAARLYPLAWARGYAQAEGEPVADVIADRHLEVLANDARFAVQRGVFGDTDRERDRTLTRAYACMLSSDARGIYETPDGGSDALDAVLDRVDEPGFCDDAANASTAFPDGPSDAPVWEALASENGYLAETEPVDLDGVATSVLGDLLADGEIEAAIERTYAVDAWTETAAEVDVVPEAHEGGSTESVHGFDVDVEGERVVDPDDTDAERELYEFDVRVTASVDRTVDGETEDAFVQYAITLTILGEHSPDAVVDRRGIDYDYESGTGGNDIVYDSNFADVPERAVEELLGVADADDAAAELEERFERNAAEIVETDAIASEAGVIEYLVERPEATIRPEPDDAEELGGWLVGQLESVEADASALEITPERHEWLRGESPLTAFETELDRDYAWVYGNVGGGYRYATVPDKVRAEIQLAFVERLREAVRELRESHEETLVELDDELSEHADVGLADTTDFAVEQFRGDPVEPAATLPDHALNDGIEIGPAGSPAYLSIDLRSRERVPLDREDAPMTVGYEERYRAPEYPNRTMVDVRTAGEILEAGRLTEDVLDATEGEGSNGGIAHLDDLEERLALELDRIVEDAARDAAGSFDGVSEAELVEAIEAAVAEEGPLERRAIALGGGESATRIAAAASREVRMPEGAAYEYYRPTFETHLESAVRRGIEEALGSNRTVSDPRLASYADSVGDDVRRELGSATEAVLEERRERAASDGLDAEGVPRIEVEWLYNELGDGTVSPNRVTSGTPLIDTPSANPLRTNVWNVDLEGEYDRFAAVSTFGTPSGDPMRYVREDGTVSLEIGGEDVTIGETRALGFESRFSVPLVVPSDSLGVGNRT